MHWMLWWYGGFFVLSTFSVTALSRNDIYNELIQKYSDSKQFLTVDQFQLLLNSINNPSNNTAHKIEELEKCDSTLTAKCSFLPQDCLTAKELLENIHVADGKLDADSLDLACSLILGQMESNVCGKHQTGKQRLEKEKPSAMEVWGLGLLFVTVISLCSLIGVSVLPFMAKAFYKQMLTVLIGLAVGSLSGSAVFHLIPQAFGLMQSDNHHNYLNISLMMWGGIWVFFMTERIMKLISDAKQNGKPRATISKDVTGELSAVTDLSPHANHEVQPLQNQLADSGSCLHANPVVIYDYQEQAIKASFGHQEKARVSHNDIVHFEQGKDSAIATVAWMVIFGDGLHNFIDGLSIGAAFSESILTGVSISLAVLCEEFPHELGDFAVLLNAGMTMKQALLYNFLSACTCYLGLILGIILGEIEANTYIFGFAGGMFLYISLVDMIPEMNEVAEEASKLGVKNACKTLLLQNLGMGIGMLALYTLARYQDSFAFS